MYKVNTANFYKFLCPILPNMTDLIPKRPQPQKVVKKYVPPDKKQKEAPKLTAEEMAMRRDAYEKYGRGEKIIVGKVKDKKLRGNMKNLEQNYKHAVLRAKDSEMLLHEERGLIETEGMERTFKLSQAELLQEVDIATAQKVRSFWIPHCLETGYRV